MSWGGAQQNFGQSYGQIPSYSTGTVAVQMQKRDPMQSWGFRLQGGRDYRQQLSIKKVQPSTPAHGRIEAGDAILTINGYDAKDLTHQQASQMIKQSGASLDLTLQKGACGGAFTSIKPKGPVKFSPGTAHQFGYK